MQVSNLNYKDLMIMSPSLLTMQLCEAISEQPAPSYHGYILRKNTLWEHWLEDGSVISNILSVSFNMNGKYGHAVLLAFCNFPHCGFQH